jgi:hypothetical protein
MLKQTLEENLFSGRGRAYAVLDGASVPDLPQKIYELGPPAVCLYRGELAPDLAEVAPYLVELQTDGAFTEWLLSETNGRTHFGIFASTRLSLADARKHFRRFLTVYTEDGKPLLFRFYDPRVLTKFLPLCSAKELAKLFSGIDFYLAENGSDGFLRFELEGGRLNTENL